MKEIDSFDCLPTGAVVISGKGYNYDPFYVVMRGGGTYGDTKVHIHRARYTPNKTKYIGAALVDKENEIYMLYMDGEKKPTIVLEALGRP